MLRVILSPKQIAEGDARRRGRTRGLGVRNAVPPGEGEVAPEESTETES